MTFTYLYCFVLKICFVSWRSFNEISDKQNLLGICKLTPLAENFPFMLSPEAADSPEAEIWIKKTQSPKADYSPEAARMNEYTDTPYNNMSLKRKITKILLQLWWTVILPLPTTLVRSHTHYHSQKLKVTLLRPEPIAKRKWKFIRSNFYVDADEKLPVLIANCNVLFRCRWEAARFDCYLRWKWIAAQFDW